MEGIKDVHPALLFLSFEGNSTKSSLSFTHNRLEKDRTHIPRDTVTFPFFRCVNTVITNSQFAFPYCDLMTCWTQFKYTVDWTVIVGKTWTKLSEYSLNTIWIYTQIILYDEGLHYAHIHWRHKSSPRNLPLVATYSIGRKCLHASRLDSGKTEKHQKYRW